MTLDNPYAANSYTGQETVGGISNGTKLSLNILIQIRVVAILLIVHGVMLLAMGAFLIVMAALMPNLLAAQQQKMGQQPGLAPAQMQTIFFATYLIMGLAGLIPGLFQIVAGIQNLFLKGRIVGVAALVSGVIALGTCYCTPTAIALMVYGLIIYLNGTATEAFSLAQRGMKWADLEKLAKE